MDLRGPGDSDRQPIATEAPVWTRSEGATGPGAGPGRADSDSDGHAGPSESPGQRRLPVPERGGEAWSGLRVGRAS